jgi:hypothetical protein
MMGRRSGPALSCWFGSPQALRLRLPANESHRGRRLFCRPRTLPSRRSFPWQRIGSCRVRHHLAIEILVPLDSRHFVLFYSLWKSVKNSTSTQRAYLIESMTCCYKFRDVAEFEF